MKLDTQKDEIQNEALKAWLNSNKKGTCEIATGLGKTFISLHALYTMPKNNKIHLFLAETTSREKDLLDDIVKYNKIFNRNVLKDYNLQFYCYQSAYKWKNKSFGLVIADEIHDSLTPAYSKFYFNNKYDAIIGLSATVNKETVYENTSKGILLDKICPVCYKYTLVTSLQKGTSRKLRVYIIQQQLNDKDKTILAGNKKVKFYQTEKASYDYWDKEHKKAWFIKDETIKSIKIRITSHKRSNILYNLKAKVTDSVTLLKHLKGKTIIFGNSLDALLKITPNVISSRYSESKNKAIRDAFEKNKISIIGSFKKLKQGANLSDLDNCIIHSYYGVEKDIIQRIGRLRKNGKLGYVFIFLTISTQEEVWFNNMFKNLENIETIYCPNINYAIKHYENNK